MKRMICLLFCAAALLVSLPPPAAGAAPAANPRLRIGLNCDSVGVAGTLVAANLANHTGNGYEFGYLDADLNFIPLGHTAETKITMLPNRNIYLSGGTYSTTPSNNAVGAYHTAHGSYSSRDEAETAVSSLRAQGIKAFVSYRSGTWLVRSDSFTSSDDGRETGSNRCITAVVTGTADILFQFEYGDTYHFSVRPAAPDGTAAQTWHRDRRYFGMFEFRRFDGNSEISVMSVIDMQEYIKGVVPYEMSPSWPAEALKAQAVAARSFAAGSLTRHRSNGYNICDTTHCQVYRGTASASANSDGAVDGTYGMYMMYNGNPCNTAVYHSSSGGATEDSENVWTNALPYLRGVPDPYENPSQYVWTYTLTNAQISAYLTSQGISNSGVTNFYISQTTAMGNARTITITGSNGQAIRTYSGDNARIFLGRLIRASHTVPSGYSFSLRYTIHSGDAMLASVSTSGVIASHNSLNSLYAIDGNGNVTLLPPAPSLWLIDSGGALHPLPTQPSDSNKGVYTVSGRGNGHNVGMSQWGARGAAEQGLTYDQILKHYFTGVEITTVS